MTIGTASFSESRFWKHIGLILIVKLIAICSLWWVFFGPENQIKLDAKHMQYQLTERTLYD